MERILLQQKQVAVMFGMMSLNIECGVIRMMEPKTIEDGDYYYSFETYKEAREFSKDTTGAEEPLALVLQEESIGEPEPGQYEHIKEQRITEWSVEFLKRPSRTSNTIPDFMSPTAPRNKLDILRGLD